MLRCTNLSLSYPGKTLCDNLSLEIAAGQSWAIIGKNGSGKTTLLHALGGLNAAASRQVFFRENNLGAYSRKTLAKNIGVLLQQEDANYWGSVRDYVMLGRYPHQRSIFGWQNQNLQLVEDAISRVGLTALASRAMHTLSGGEGQRARIALLLYQQPQIFLLDEPLQHLDLQYQQQTLKIFTELAQVEKRAVVMVLHDLMWIPRYCDHALLLYEGGHFILGPTAEVLNVENLENLYKCRLKAVESDFGRIFLPC